MTNEIIHKAKKALTSARIPLQAGDSDGATNRAYYAMFDATIAALSWAAGGSALDHPKTHGGLIGSFGLHLVRTGKLPAELGRSLNRVQELRLTADYLADPVTSERADWAIREAETFLAAIQQLLSQPP